MLDCYIWQACRATSAAPTFFPSVTIVYQKYVDGALGYNNPIRPLLAEAHQLWGEKRPIGCIISIGTGVPRLGNFGQRASLVKTLKEIATDTQTVANEMKTEMISRYGSDQQVFLRFNVDRGLGALGLEECQPRHRAQMHTATNLYLDENADRLEYVPAMSSHQKVRVNLEYCEK
jgi:predicted acylesterase/phospholipase RssA